jgi:hypothetical protein
MSGLTFRIERRRSADANRRGDLALRNLRRLPNRPCRPACRKAPAWGDVQEVALSHDINGTEPQQSEQPACVPRHLWQHSAPSRPATPQESPPVHGSLLWRRASSGSGRLRWMEQTPGVSSRARRHIQHPLPVGEQSLRNGPAHAVGALNHPHPLRPLMGNRQHSAASTVTSRRPRSRAAPRGVSRASTVTDCLCGSIPITTRSITILLTSTRLVASVRRATLFRAEQTLLQPRLAAVPGPDRMP